jgi:YVTN family beta-propeller protein
LASSSDGSTVYILNSGVSLTSSAKTISILNTANNEITGAIDGFNGPDAIALTSNGKSAYVANYGYYDYVNKSIKGVANTINLVDLATKKIIKTITVGRGPDSLAISGNNLYVANFYDNNISVVNMQTHAVSTIADPKNNINGPYTIVVNPNGQYAYVSNYGNPIKPDGYLKNTISVINLKTNTVEKSILVSTSPSVKSSPAGLAITSDGKYVYVTNYTKNGTVAVIDTSNNSVVSRINVGNLPGAITISPDNTRAYVTNYSDNSVSIIHLKNL